jgi:hypothetical protein
LQGAVSAGSLRLPSNSFISTNGHRFSSEVRTIPMRLSMIRACVVATAAAAALTACAGHGIVPSSQTGLNPVTSDTSQMTSDAGQNQLAVITCAKSPPQYGWIFKGACTHFSLKPTGTSFKLQEYQDITVRGSIGANDVKGSAIIYLADAVDKGDIQNFAGKKFPPYKAKGTTFVYAAADNQTSQAIKPKVEKNKRRGASHGEIGKILLVVLAERVAG